MPSANAPAFTVGQVVTAKVADYNPDGTTLDTTEGLSLSVSPTGFVLVAVDSADNRSVKITGSAPGTCVVTVSAPGVQAGAGLAITCVVSAPPPNLSRIDLVSFSGPV